MRPLVIQGVIFDIDGTLVDSNDAHAHAWQEAFARFGREIAWDVIRSQIGKGGDLLVPDLLDARDMRSFGEELKKYRGELFKSKYLGQLRPFPGIPGTFEALRAAGLRLALASSAQKDEANKLIDLLGVADLIEGSTSADDAEISKPAPGIFEAALSKIGVDGTKTLTVGDSPYDILAAHRIALPIAAVRCGGFPGNILEKAEFVFEDVREIPGRLEEIDGWFRE